MSKLVSLALCLVGVVACGDSGTAPDGSTGGGNSGPGAGGGGAGGGNGSGAAGSGAASAGGGGTGGGGSGGSAATLPACVLACSSANDCATASVLTDADNWTCNASRCEYLGCQSDLECQQGLFNANYVCEVGVAGLPACVLACTSPSDCATASVLTDADNWSCTTNRCEYLGCQSDLECQQGLLNPNYSCDDGGVIPACALACTTTAECATASVLTDADNWSCSGQCEYLGCQSTAECQQGLANPGYVCE